MATRGPTTRALRDLRRRRVALVITQERLAQLAGVASATIRLAEKRGRAKVDVADRIEVALSAEEAKRDI